MIPLPTAASSSNDAKRLADKYRAVADTQDGFDVLLDILLTLYWRGTLQNEAQVTLHNAAEEIVAKFGGLESGMDWQNPTLRAQFRSALGENRKPLTERSFPERPQDGGI